MSVGSWKRVARGTRERLNFASGSVSGDQFLMSSGCQHPPYGCCAYAPYINMAANAVKINLLFLIEFINVSNSILVLESI